MEKLIEQKLARALGAEDTELLPYIPYLLQDLTNLGTPVKPVIDMLVAHIPDIADCKALDLGAGKGCVGISVSRETGAAVHMVDAYPEFIKCAKSKAAEAGLANCTFRVEDVTQTVKAARGYDLVMLLSVGNIFGDFSSLCTVKALAQTVKKGGYLLIEESYFADAAFDVKCAAKYETLADWLCTFKNANVKLIAQYDEWGAEDGIDFDNPKNNVSKGRAWRFHRSEKDGRIYINFMSNGWDYIENATRKIERGATYYIDPGDDRWTRCNWLVGNGSVRVLNEIAVDPTNPDIIYVTGRAGIYDAKVRYGGCHKSTNGGKTWTEIFPNTINCESIRIDPRDTNILYLTNANGFIQVSYDAGESWVQSREFVNHMNPKVATPDWRDEKPTNMFVCTGGGSVFYGPLPPKGGYKD